MIRIDKLGAATSVIRSLGLNPIYEPVNRYFRSDGYDLYRLEDTWCGYIAENAPLIRINGYALMIGDGIKVSKEGKRIPAVKRLYQESENSAKPQYITGLMFGGVGVVAEKAGKAYCIPLACEIQDGAKEIMSWNESDERQGTHVTELIDLAYRSSLRFGKTAIIMDRFVLVKMDGVESIIASTDLTLDPLDIIKMYGRRFSIENIFNL